MGRPRTYHRPHQLRWRKYVTRRVLIVSAVTILSYALSYFLHIYYAEKGGEMCLGMILGHWLLEVE